MYQREDNARAGRTGPDGLGTVAPEVRAGHAAARACQACTVAPPGFSLERGLLQTALAAVVADPLRESERCFALGWLRWLAGEPESAEPLLNRAVELLPTGRRNWPGPPTGWPACVFSTTDRMPSRPSSNCCVRWPGRPGHLLVRGPLWRWGGRTGPSKCGSRCASTAG